MSDLQLKPVFVNNKNVRNFLDLMAGVDRNPGEGRLACVWGRAGRGKTRTVQWWHSEHQSVYLRIRGDWDTSRVSFAKALARELGFLNPPWSASLCIDAIISRLIEEPVPVFLDEPERLPRAALGIIRDLTDLTGAPFILVGEEELFDWMARERRVWSRTAEQMEFQPWAAGDVIVYAKEAGGLRLSAQAADVFHRASEGDIRNIKMDLGTALRIANSKGGGPEGVSPEIAKTAVDARKKKADRRPGK
jgi:hypothetical protein